MAERSVRSDSNIHSTVEEGPHTLNGHINGILSPDTPVEDVKAYLLNPQVYGSRRSRRSFFAYPSRNFRPSGSFK